MRLIGIDPSLRSTGVAGLGWAEHIDTKGMTGHERINYIRGTLHEFLPSDDQVIAVIEEPPANGRGASTRPLVGLHAIILQDLWAYGVEYAEVHPSTLKMYATDNGRASKDEMMDEMLDLHPTMTFENDDESDAYALLTMGHHYYGLHMGCCGGYGGGHRLPEHSRVDLALSHVKWPESNLRRLVNEALERRD